MVQSSLSMNFNATYTMHGQELEDELAGLIKEEIDWDILSDILNNTLGWTKVTLGRLNNREHAVVIQDWIRENCKSNIKYRGATFLFEDSKEAEWFSLRWL